MRVWGILTFVKDIMMRTHRFFNMFANNTVILDEHIDAMHFITGLCHIIVCVLITFLEYRFTPANVEGDRQQRKPR